jgi:hypothetical protein
MEVNCGAGQDSYGVVVLVKKKRFFGMRWEDKRFWAE